MLARKIRQQRPSVPQREREKRMNKKTAREEEIKRERKREKERERGRKKEKEGERGRKREKERAGERERERAEPQARRASRTTREKYWNANSQEMRTSRRVAGVPRLEIACAL